MTVDRSNFSFVVLCDQCEWRAVRGTPQSAWAAAAIHAKRVHNDRLATRRAAENLRRAKEKAAK